MIRRLRRNGWRWWHLALAIGLIVVTVAATWRAWVSIWAYARQNEEARHILLVPPVALYLAWVRRPRVWQCRPMGQWVGVLAFAVAAVVYVLAELGRPTEWDVDWFRGGWDFLMHASAVAVTLGCIVTAFGVDVLRKFLPAFAVLFFMIPLPETVASEVTLPLQVASAEIAVRVYQAFGIDAGLDAVGVRIGSNRLRIAQVVQGLPIMFDLFLVSYAFVFGIPLRAGVRVIILLASPLSAILCGVIGLICTLWLYGFLSPRHIAWVHQAGGWLILVAAFLALTGVIKVLSWASVPVRPYTLAYDW